MQKMRRGVPGTGAAAFFVQQSLWRVPALPGIRKYRGFRSGSRDPGQKQNAERRRDRAVDQAALPATDDGHAAVRARERDSHGRALSRSHVGAAPRNTGWRQIRRLCGREGIFWLAGAQEIQTARSRFLEPLSRLRDLPGLPWHAAARGSSRGEDCRTLDYGSLPDDRKGRAAVFSELAIDRDRGGDRREGAGRNAAAAAVFG